MFSKQEINPSYSLGGYLRKKREEKGLSLKEISQKINISEKNLIFLEEENFDRLPPEIYLKGFLKKYAEFLNLDLEELLELYKKEKEILEYLKRKKYFPKFPKKTFFVIIPKFFSKIIISLIVLTIFAYLAFQIFYFVFPPFLRIDNPEPDRKIFREEILKISGKTVPRVELFINGQKSSVKKNGFFEKEIKLEEGLNKISILARNKIGKEKEIIREVIRNP